MPLCRSPAATHGDHHGPLVAHPPSKASQAAGEHGGTAVVMLPWRRQEGKAAGGWGRGAVLMVVLFVFSPSCGPIVALLASFLYAYVPRQLCREDFDEMHKLMLDLCPIVARSVLTEQLRMRHVQQALCMRIVHMP